jgi:transposase
MNISRIGLDLAKNVFQVHGIDAQGRVVLNKPLKRAQMAEFFARLPACTVAMEACGSAHHWGRKLMALGHAVRLIAPQHVKPYVARNKNDARDAAAICEAAGRSNMKYVAVKTIDQQALLALHRARDGLVTARTALGNQLRGLLAEFGVIFPQGAKALRQGLASAQEEADNGLPPLMRRLIGELSEHLRELERHITHFDGEILAWHREHEASRRLADIPGIGPLTASALVASVGDVRVFASARQFAAWLGLTPREHSSGGHRQLLGISKQGDAYLRRLLVHGARSVVKQIQPTSTGWLADLLRRRPKNVAVVAQAQKNARTAWALLARGETYRPVMA